MLKKFLQYVRANVRLVAARAVLVFLFGLFVAYPVSTMVYHSFNGDAKAAASAQKIHGRLSGTAIYNCADKTLEAAENVQYKGSIPRIEEQYLAEIKLSYAIAIDFGTKHGSPELKWVQSKLDGILAIEKAQNEALKNKEPTVVIHPSCWDEYHGDVAQSGGAYR